jgi:hypothetical protein
MTEQGAKEHENCRHLLDSLSPYVDGAWRRAGTGERP